MESLALGSVGESTQKNYLGKWNIWVKERRAQGKGPWLHTLVDPDQVLGEVLHSWRIVVLCITTSSRL